MNRFNEWTHGTARDARRVTLCGGVQVPLYVEFHPEELMKFLQHSLGYDLNDALAECASKGMTREQVYLLGRMGGSRRALEIIVDELGDIPQAIAFVQEQGADDDDELWDELIARAVAKPGCVCDLLDNVGSLFDPRRVLSRIPPALVVDGLRDRLAGMSHSPQPPPPTGVSRAAPRLALITPRLFQSLAHRQCTNLIG